MPQPTLLAPRTPLLAALKASAPAHDQPIAPGSVAPDFRVYTGPMATYGTLDPLTKAVTSLQGQPYPHGDDLARFMLQMRAGSLSKSDIDDLLQIPRPVVRMTGSSSEQDLEGDIMERTALDDMTKCRDNLTIFRDHSYSLPRDLYGTMVGLPWLQIQDGITDLWLQSDVEVINLDSLETYLYTLRGRSIGVSGGFMILEARWIDRKTGKPVDEDSLSFEDVISGAVSLSIVRTKAVEWSTVGIPANQRSWVGGAAKGLFVRTGHPLLAPIVRNYLPDRRDWVETLREAHGVTQETKAALEDVEPRRSLAPQGATLYSFPSDQPGDGWTYRVKTGKHWRELSRSEVGDLLARTLATPPAPPAEAPKALEPDATKGASGKADWPLAERDRAWDSGAAHKRILDWAGGGDGSDGFSPAKMKSVHFWFDASAPDKVGSYKLLYCDVVDGSVKAIPRAIFACTGSHGVDAADIPEADKAAIKKRIERQYARMREAFDDDSLYPSWQQGTDGDAGGKALPEDDMLTKRAGGVKVAADGTHEPWTGTHTHAHKAFGSQGDDGLHEHQHSHDGDSDHHHSHTQKAGEPDTTKDGTPDTTKASDGTSIDGDGNHAPMTGRHRHAHKAYGMPNADSRDMHAHDHEHKGENNHGHDHYGTDGTDGGPKAGEPELTGDLTAETTTKAPKIPPREGGDAARPVGPCPNCDKAVPPEQDSMRCAMCGHCLNCGAGPIPMSAMKCASCGVKMSLDRAGEPDATKDGAPTPAAASQTVTKAAPLDADTSVTAAQRQALLASYNSLGTLLGFAPVALDAAPDSAKAVSPLANPETAQRVVTLVSQIDTYTDALCRINVYGLDSAVDELMGVLGVPDVDEPGEINGDEMSDPSAMRIPASPYYAQTGTRPNLRKAGRRHSQRDVSDLQSIHDAVARLTDGEVCRGMNVEPQGDNTPDQGGAGSSEGDARDLEAARADQIASQANTHNTRAGEPDVTAALYGDLVKSLADVGTGLKGIDLPALHKQVEATQATITRAAEAAAQYERQYKELSANAGQLSAQMAAMRKAAGGLQEQQDWLARQVETLANVPLPRPTMLHRSVDLDDPIQREAVATYQDMAGVNIANKAAALGIAPGEELSLERALALTVVKTVDGLEYRQWPAGVVPAGGRPELGNFAKITMSWDQMTAYRSGGECLVPTRDEQLPVVVAAAAE